MITQPYINKIKGHFNSLLGHNPKSLQSVSTPQTLAELNTKTIQPAVLINFRIYLIKKMLEEYNTTYTAEEARKKNMSGFSKQAQNSIEILSILSKNIFLLQEELLHLETLSKDLLVNYKSYLQLLDIPPHV